MNSSKSSYQLALEAVGALSDEERDRLFEHFNGEDVGNNVRLISKDIADVRFAKGYICPNPECRKTHVDRHGHAKNGAQRYICKDCGKTFVSSTESVLEGIKKDSETIKKYFFCMANGWSLRKSAEYCQIHRNTAFNWRHKIFIPLIANMNQTRLDGIVEADGTYFPESFTGNHTNDGFVMPRGSRRRGEKASKRGISDQQICVIGAVNREGQYFFRVVGNGRPTSQQVKDALVGHVEPASTLCTDGHASYRQFAKDEWVNLVQIKGGRGTKKGIYHVQHANNLHDCAKKMVSGFNGVATKHLPGYMAWGGLILYNSSRTSLKEKEEKLAKITMSYYGKQNCLDISSGTFKLRSMV